MKKNYFNQPDGYRETIRKGMSGVRDLASRVVYDTGEREEQIKRLKREIENADAIVIGAGAGLTYSAGLSYDGARFERYFSDFAQKYGIKDMYSGGFYPFPDEETYWAWWSRHIYYNRYIDPPRSLYRDLLEIIEDKDYFIITTNVDHQFQRAGYDKKRLFYTQGDYGLFQKVHPTLPVTWDNEEDILKMMDAQGFQLNEQGIYDIPEGAEIKMQIPTELIPRDPQDGDKVVCNLRADDTFVEDEGWHRASAAYSDFLRRHDGLHVLFLEMGVGGNTPVIIKYPFWKMTYDNSNAVYACVNYSDAFCPRAIRDRSICIEGDIGEIISLLN